MENPKSTKINIPQNFLDIRQSDSWAQYLESLGWKNKKTSYGTNINLRKIGPFNVTKIQRPKKLDEKGLEELEKVCNENKALFIKIEPCLDQDLNLLDKTEYTKSNFPLVPPTTIFIDLTKEEKNLWEAISHSGKYSIKRAQREKTKIEYCQNPDDGKIKIFCGVAKETGQRKNFFVPNFNDVKKKVELFKDDSHLIMAYKESGELAGANFYLGFQESVWYLHGGTSDIGRKCRAGYELYWQSFLYFKKLGYKILDLEGKDDDRFPLFTKYWGGFSHFKEKFGGYEVVYPEPRIKPLHPALKFLAKFQKLSL